MAWTAPMTAVSGNIFKASEFNTHIRDNLLQTAPSFNTPTGAFFVTSGTNVLRTTMPQGASVTTSQTTTSTSYANLTTVGPTVADITVQSFTLVGLGAEVSNSASGNMTRMSLEVTGAFKDEDGNPITTFNFPANDAWSVGQSTTVAHQFGGFFVFNLQPGTYTITAKYKVAGGTGTFANRSLYVFPF